MTCSEREQALLYRLIRECEQAGAFSGERFLETLERHLGLRDTVYFEGGPTLRDVSERPLAVRGRAAPMLPAYLGRYHHYDAFRTPVVARMVARRGIADLGEIPTDVLDQHREYVVDFHGRFGTRTITLVQLPGVSRAGYVFALDFESDAPCREVELLHEVRGILGLQLERGALPVDAGIELLSTKERRIAELVARGFSNAEIAGTLDIKVDTVKKYLTAIYAACGVRSRTQLAVAFRP